LIVPDGDLKNLNIIHFRDSDDPNLMTCNDCVYTISMSKTLDTLLKTDIIGTRTDGTVYKVTLKSSVDILDIIRLMK